MCACVWLLGKANFHKRQSQGPSCNQKCRALRSSEIQTDEVVRRAPIFAYGSIAFDLVKTRLLKLQEERKHLEGVLAL